jgi:integrase
MASIYKRPGSKFWWVKYRDHVTGEIKRQSTKFRIGIGTATRAANEMCANLTAKENQSTFAGAHERWEEWVTPFLESKHSASPNTLSRNLLAWSTILRYLRSQGVLTPKMLTRGVCIGYVPWRKKEGHLNSTKKRQVGTNTVIGELKTLSKVMHEAILRGYVPYNPAIKLGISKDKIEEKSEMTDEHIGIIRDKIRRKIENAKTLEEKRNSHFYRVSFEIALHQGCRLSETHIRLTDIDEKNRKMRFVPKGGEPYVAEMNPSLVPLIEELRASGVEYTYDRPLIPSLKWFKFFNQLRAKYPEFDRVSFHSTRVTCISRLERAGAPESAVMKLVGHSSTTIHRIYKRTKSDELQSFWSAVAPLACPDTSESSESQG